MADTTSKGFPYPEGADAVDVAGDIQALAEAVDDMPGVQSYTAAQITALSAGQRWAGRVVWNSTASKLQVSNGSTFTDVDTTLSLASSNPAALGVVAVGTGSTAARSDHVHPTTGLLLNTIVDAKGDIIAASADNTPARLPVGANGQALIADSSASTGLAWARVGKILQVVETNLTSTVSVSVTTAGVFYDVTGLSATITPTATSSKILVVTMLTGATLNSDVGTVYQRLMRDSTAIAVGDAASSRPRVTTGNGYAFNGTTIAGATVVWLDSPATTSATTYKLQATSNQSAVTAHFNRTQSDANDAGGVRAASSIVLLEVGA